MNTCCPGWCRPCGVAASISLVGLDLIGELRSGGTVRSGSGTGRRRPACRRSAGDRHVIGLLFKPQQKLVPSYTRPRRGESLTRKPDGRSRRHQVPRTTVGQRCPRPGARTRPWVQQSCRHVAAPSEVATLPDDRNIDADHTRAQSFARVIWFEIGETWPTSLLSWPTDGSGYARRLPARPLYGQVDQHDGRRRVVLDDG